MSNKKRRNKLHFKPLISTKNQQPEKKDGKALIRAGLIVTILLCAVVGFGAFVQWRNTTANSAVSEKINSARSLPPPLPTPQYEASQPAREYVYGGGKLLAVSEPVRPAPNDLAIWRILTGTWWVLNDDGTYSAQQWGLSSDLPAPGDYDGDGKTDFCVFRPSEGNWYVMQTGSNNSMAVYPFGVDGDKPVPADFDGDGRTDLVVYRPDNRTWYVYKMASGTDVTFQFGQVGDEPVPSDYDGDGKADYALWRNSDASWQIWQSGSNSQTSLQWGINSDKPVQGDYDGDGKTDHAVWRNDNNWYVRQSTNGNWMVVNWGYQSSDLAVQGDYDSDGKTDIAVWRPSNGTWYIRKSSTGTLRAQQWGQQGDTPVPAPYRRVN